MFLILCTINASLMLVPCKQVLGCNRQIYALKRVRLANKDPEAIRGFIDEISLLKQLRNTPNIIQLISAQVRRLCTRDSRFISSMVCPCSNPLSCLITLVQVFRDEGLIYMVLEYGDIDLAHLLHNHEEARQQRAAGTSLPCVLWFRRQ
jgi:serine/threonine-protein kinase TTK/MPS1